MSEFETVMLDVDSRGVASLTLNRPHKRNALSARMIDELREATRQIAADAKVRVVVLKAAGRDFCAGGDLGWMQQQFHAPRGRRIEEASRLAEMLRALDELPRFVIGVIEGAALGGGVGLVAVCDMVIAAPSARFALTETRLGLIPATIAPYLQRRIGPAAMRRLALHGLPFGAEEGKAIGLVAEIVAADGLAEAQERHIGMALACAPGAIGDAKRLFRAIANGEADRSACVAALAERWETEEARDGIAAFFNKVEPPWRK